MQHLPAILRAVNRAVERHYLDLSPARVVPLGVLVVYGVVAGLVFNTGIDHPWDKVQHLVFFGLLTLAIHAFFCCKLRVSAAAALSLGMAGEVVQSVLPNREASLADVGANTIGVALVVAAILLLRAETRAALAEADADGEATADPLAAPVAAPAASGPAQAGRPIP